MIELKNVYDNIHCSILWHAYHGLCGSYKLLYKRSSLVNGKRQISTPNSSDIYWPIVLKLKLKKHVRQATAHDKFLYDRIKGVGGANTQFVTVLVLCLFVFFCLCILRTASWPYRWTDYDARWLIGRVFRQGSAFWGWEKLISKSNWFIRKNRKIYNGDYGEI